MEANDFRCHRSVRERVRLARPSEHQKPRSRMHGVPSCIYWTWNRTKTRSLRGRAPPPGRVPLSRDLKVGHVLVQSRPAAPGDGGTGVYTKVAASNSSQRIGCLGSGTVQTRSPPGRRMRAHSSRTADGSSTYSRTLAATIASKVLEENGSLRHFSSSCIHSTAPLRSCELAERSMISEMSHPVTCSPVAAAARAISPVPHPKSSTRPPAVS